MKRKSEKKYFCVIELKTHVGIIHNHDTHIKIEPMINPIEVKQHKMNET